MITAAHSTSLHELLDNVAGNRSYEIPRYQRAYSWTQQHWETLFDDINEEETGYFLGTIICVPVTGVPTSQGATLEVIDGQQRLTTLTLLLAAINAVWHRLAEEEKNEGREYDEDTRFKFRVMKDYLLKGNEPRLRLQSSDSNDLWYSWVVRTSLDPTAKHKDPKLGGNQNIFRAWKYFIKKIETTIQAQDQIDESMLGVSEVERLLNFLNKVIKTLLINVEVENQANAYVLFESLNNRGKALTSTDLIKNSALSQADQQGLDIDVIGDLWVKILERLGPDYRDHERFLRYFYLSIRGKDKTPKYLTKTRLIPVYTGLVKDDLEILLGQLDKGSEIYARIIGSEEYVFNHELDKHIERLMRLGSNQHEMLLLKLMYNKQELDLSDDQLAELAKFLVSFYLRRNVMNVPAANFLHRQIIEIIDSLMDYNGQELVEFVKKELIRHSSKDQAFLQYLTYSAAYDLFKDSTRFMLFEIAADSHTDETKQNLWEVSKNKSVWSIEHVAPQVPRENSDWTDFFGGLENANRIYGDYVHRLGNLTITRYNSNLGSQNFTDKKNLTDQKGNSIGFRNGISLNTKIVDKESWGPSEIDERTNELVEKILNKYPLE